MDDGRQGRARARRAVWGALRHRRGLLRAARSLVEARGPRGQTRQVRWLFLRALGLVNLIAFTSLRAQVRGLYGRRGILPLQPALEGLKEDLGPRRWRSLPSVLWLGASDDGLSRALAAGQLASLGLTLNLAPRLSAAAAWALYQSFLEVGQDFMGFQWDALLQETNLHAALIAPGGLRPGLGRTAPSRASVALMRGLVARLYFDSGIAKKQGGDPRWRDYTALRYYYETAPLPTRLGWSAHQLPAPVQKATTFAALWLEVACPLGCFGPRPARLASFAGFTGLQAGIAATGNYGFFNLLSQVLGLWLLDDAALPRALRLKGAPARRPGRLRSAVGLLLHAPLALAALSEVAARWRHAPPLVRKVRRRALQWRLTSPYGLFSAMTVDRPEIVLEGSNDGRSWAEYAFRYKPDRVDKPPRFNAPHQPRLDWQLWFAALGRPPAWFPSLLARLLEGSPEVLRLLAETPFDGAPPKMVRALLYDYRMTDRRTRRRTGAWWRRELLGAYFPPVALSPDSRPDQPVLLRAPVATARSWQPS